jgi:GrpB-like predicted nucleotidyltransferase (UPF0157 family)
MCNCALTFSKKYYKNITRINEMIIEEYNYNWIGNFILIKNILEKNLTKAIKIEHIGSTAIIGMCAKPIIDIDVVAKDDNDFNIIKNELELIGYYHNGDQGVNGREVFKRENNYCHNILDRIAHHLYVCTINNEALKRHIYFRDYLNKNKEVMFEYYKIKIIITNEIGNEDRKNYQKIKEEKYKWFFDSVIKKAEMENK